MMVPSIIPTSMEYLFSVKIHIPIASRKIGAYICPSAIVFQDPARLSAHKIRTGFVNSGYDLARINTPLTNIIADITLHNKAAFAGFTSASGLKKNIDTGGFRFGEGRV